MKRGFLAVLTALFIVASAYAVDVNYGMVDSKFNYLHVYTLKYEPYPVEPGRYADVWLKVENTGVATMDKVAVTLNPQYPFSLDESDTPQRTLTQLAEGQTALLHYKVRVAVGAIEGANPLFFSTTVDGSTQSSSVSIWVQTISANVVINAVDTDRIAPGETKPVMIEVANPGDSPLNNVDMNLNLNDATNPFVPINSTSEIKLPFLEPHSSKNITFLLQALPSSKADTYKIPITTQFTDNTGANYTRSSVIGLTVGSRPDISITIADSKIYGVGDNNIVSLKFTNKGLSNIKFLNVHLNDTKNYTVISENTLYIGNIDSDDYETADYRIKVNKAKDNIVPLLVRMEYLDANNNKYSETRSVDMKIFSAKERGVQTGNSGFGTIVLLAIVIGGGYYAYRRWEKKKLTKK